MKQNKKKHKKKLRRIHRKKKKLRRIHRKRAEAPRQG